MDLERLFEKGELIPAIVQQAGTNEVLMLAYMNRESLAFDAGNRLHLFFQQVARPVVEKGRDFGPCAAGTVGCRRLRL